MIGKTLRHKTPAFQGIRGVLEAACRLILLGALATVFVSCSSAVVKDSSVLHPRSLIWPSPPEPARISYLMSISRPDDIGVNKGFFKKLVEFVLGEETND
ncbi:MAG: hypothetical protein HZB83_06635, partial [Deltaproteobacteria bacterium]|nr:hypothetical protein [Deltaproteobacteria bacterium]